MKTISIERCNDIDYKTFKIHYLSEKNHLFLGLFQLIGRQWKNGTTLFRSKYGNLEIPVSGDWSKKMQHK